MNILILSVPWTKVLWVTFFVSFGKSTLQFNLFHKDPYISNNINKSDSFGCPEPIVCDPRAVYREFDGKCNNLVNILWGAANIIFRRSLPSQYDDGLKEVRGSMKGVRNRPALPTARHVTAALVKLPYRECDARVSVLAMEWGQFISHDITFTPASRGDLCCNTTANGAADPECLPLDVKGDPFYKQFNISCLQNTRSLPAGSLCNRGPREQVNEESAYLDGSLIYGLSKNFSRDLRSLSKGQLKTGGAEVTSGQCPALSSCPFSFLPTINNFEKKFVLTGDDRGSQQPALLSMHTLFIRVHNDLAARLSKTHPSYNDETLFQETRRVVVALIQHITYNEYLPSVLPYEALVKYRLSPLPSGYFRSYDENEDASIFNAFSAAAYRFGHSQIPNSIMLANGSNVLLAKSFLNSEITFNPGTYPSDFLNGISSQMAQVVDQNLVESITNKLFARGPSFQFGSDLFSKNIMRGRDHGLPPYNAWRSHCGFSAFKNFEQLKLVMHEDVAKAFKALYPSVNDIDLYPAAISELPSGNGIVGPTLTCLISHQFYKLKFGDRYYYEGDAQPKLFSNDQLACFRRTTIASLLCRYTNAKEVPLRAMLYSKDGFKTNCEEIVKNSLMVEFEKYW